MEVPARAGVLLVWATLSNACQPAEAYQLVAETPWPGDAFAVAVVFNVDGILPEGGIRVLEPGSKWQLGLTGAWSIWALSFPAPKEGGPDLLRCGVTFGGGGRPLPFEAGQQWVTREPLDASSSSIEWLAKEASEPPWDLRFVDVQCERPACERFRVTRQSGALWKGFLAKAATFLSPDEVLVGGAYTSASPQKHASALFRVRRGVEPELVAMGPAGFLSGIAWDRRHTAWASLDVGTYRVDLDARELQPIKEGNHRVRDRSDGLAVAFKLGQGPVMNLSAGTSTVVPFPSALFVLEMPSTQAMAALGDQEIHTYDGSRWQTEVTPYLRFDPSSAVALGPTTDAVVGRSDFGDVTGGQLFLRKKGTASFTREQSPHVLRFAAVAAVEDILLAGGTGQGPYGEHGALIGIDPSTEVPRLRICNFAAAEETGAVNQILWDPAMKLGVVASNTLNAAKPSELLWIELTP